MQRPWLSAIVPCHNGERWLAVALQSVAAQHDRGIEVIVIDSSDSPASVAIAESLAADLNLRCYRRPDLGAWTDKTNFGVDIAGADWVCMLHQDDFWLGGRRSAVKCWIAAHPAAAMHLHSAYIVDAAGRRLCKWRCPLPVGGAVPLEVILQRLLVQEFIAIPTPTIRRDAFLRVGGLDSRLPQTADWDLYLRLLFAGEIYYHPETLACFRIHSNSQTMANIRRDDYRTELETVLHRYIGKLGAAKSETLRLAEASIAVNVALAAASIGRPRPLFGAIAAVCRLGPRGILKYLHYSRIVERSYPRLRARLAGAL